MSLVGVCPRSEADQLRVWSNAASPFLSRNSQRSIPSPPVRIDL